MCIVAADTRGLGTLPAFVIIAQTAMDSTLELEGLTDDWVAMADCVTNAVPTDDVVTDQWMMDVMERVDYDDFTQPWEPVAPTDKEPPTDHWMMDVMERVDYDDSTQPCGLVAPTDKEPPTGEDALDLTARERLQAITRISLSLGYACSLAFDVGGPWACEICATLQEDGEASLLPSGKAACKVCSQTFHSRNC